MSNYEQQPHLSRSDEVCGETNSHRSVQSCKWQLLNVFIASTRYVCTKYRRFKAWFKLWKLLAYCVVAGKIRVDISYFVLILAIHILGWHLLKFYMTEYSFFFDTLNVNGFRFKNIPLNIRFLLHQRNKLLWCIAKMFQSSLNTIAFICKIIISEPATQSRTGIS